MASPMASLVTGAVAGKVASVVAGAVTGVLALANALAVAGKSTASFSRPLQLTGAVASVVARAVAEI